jgi:hypothetical protein
MIADPGEGGAGTDLTAIEGAEGVVIRGWSKARRYQRREPLR